MGSNSGVDNGNLPMKQPAQDVHKPVVPAQNLGWMGLLGLVGPITTSSCEAAPCSMFNESGDRLESQRAYVRGSFSNTL